jgi:hypothetical protein
LPISGALLTRTPRHSFAIPYAGPTFCAILRVPYAVTVTGRRGRSAITERFLTQALRLSELQIDVLLLGAHHKLDRSSLGWSYDDRMFPTDPVWLIRPSTIKSLHERGLLDANFNDARVHTGEFAAVQNFDGARHEDSPDAPKLQVWTSALGIKVLRDKGLLPEYAKLKNDELRYH